MSLKSLKLNLNTESLKRYFKIFSFGVVRVRVGGGGVWHQTFPHSVLIIYSSMAPPVIDDVDSFWACINPFHLLTLYAMFSVARNSTVDHIHPVKLR